MDDLPIWMAVVLGFLTFGTVLLRWIRDHRALEMLKELHNETVRMMAVRLAETEKKQLASVLDAEEKYIAKIDRLQRRINELEKHFDSPIEASSDQIRSEVESYNKKLIDASLKLIKEELSDQRKELIESTELLAEEATELDDKLKSGMSDDQDLFDELTEVAFPSFMPFLATAVIVHKTFDKMAFWRKKSDVVK